MNSLNIQKYLMVLTNEEYPSEISFITQANSLQLSVIYVQKNFEVICESNPSKQLGAKPSAQHAWQKTTVLSKFQI